MLTPTLFAVVNLVIVSVIDEKNTKLVIVLQTSALCRRVSSFRRQVLVYVVIVAAADAVIATPVTF